MWAWSLNRHGVYVHKNFGSYLVRGLFLVSDLLSVYILGFSLGPFFILESGLGSLFLHLVWGQYSFRWYGLGLWVCSGICNYFGVCSDSGICNHFA